MKRQFKASTPRTPESWMLQYGDRGAVFYTKKSDKSITAWASQLGRKVTTKRGIIMTGSLQSPVVSYITEVTLINDPAIAGQTVSTY